MNNRQKAKHFRRLYEQSLPIKPYPIVYQPLPLKHYRAHCSFSDSIPMREVSLVLTRQLQEVIQNNIVEFSSFSGREKEYEIDLWVRK